MWVVLTLSLMGEDLYTNVGVFRNQMKVVIWGVPSKKGDDKMS